MTNQLAKKNTLTQIFHSTLVSLPAPPNLSTLWNLGSLLSICLIIQLISGLLLASAYAPDIISSFSSISLIIESSESGWLIRYIHANGASLFFVCLYTHTGRGLYFSSFIITPTWIVGVTIILITIAAAFLGYVLPANQISFWGASVITNLFSEVPYIGADLVKLIWGGIRVHNPTLIRFFIAHFILPFIILALVIIHITLLHQTGSRNPLGVKSNLDKIPFHSFFSIKDSLGSILTLLSFLILCLYYPLILGDDENFILANPSVTPNHIQPEWYFLFAYAILRSIPNKLGGVIALVISIMILFVPPIIFIAKLKSTSFYPLNKILFWSFVSILFLLTWIGIRPVEEPFVITGQILTVLYFLFYFINPILMKLWDRLIGL